MRRSELGTTTERTWGLSLLFRLEPRKQRDCPRVCGVPQRDCPHVCGVCLQEETMDCPHVCGVPQRDCALFAMERNCTRVRLVYAGKQKERPSVWDFHWRWTSCP